MRSFKKKIELNAHDIHLVREHMLYDATNDVLMTKTIENEQKTTR